MAFEERKEGKLMTAHGLLSFVTIVERGSFTVAAEELYTSQSALSQQIRTLETQLGFDLFDHTVHRVSLTAAGKVFYPKAKQILALYDNAVFEAKAVNSTASQKRLRIGTLGDQIFQVWVELLYATSEIADKYFPAPMRFSSRAELYRALQQGRVDLSLQLENADIELSGLLFSPLITCRELCTFFQGAQLPQNSCVELAELETYRIAFHYEAGHNLYEDALRRELRQRQMFTKMLDPQDFFEAEYGMPTALLVPEIYYPKDKMRYARFVRWGEGLRFGFVHTPHCDPKVLEYIRHVTDWVEAHGNPWGTAERIEG
jgi:DNA-binding transcriptional LysR family regulator